ncbi:MAG: hypothetical protein K2H87_04965 [Duncaniella sp.]|nr:hypothetical protein [Duncaniella sp.]
MAETMLTPERQGLLGALLPEGMEERISELAAMGLTPAEIAAASGMVPGVAEVFVELADEPGSPVANLIDGARLNGFIEPQRTILAAVAKGDLEASKTLREIQAENRLRELIAYMDDDELAG